jgi:hypothetical protein
MTAHVDVRGVCYWERAEHSVVIPIHLCAVLLRPSFQHQYPVLEQRHVQRIDLPAALAGPQQLKSSAHHIG